MRLFFALPVAEPLRTRLTAAQEGLRSVGLVARWTHPADLHLTLAFLGERPEGDVSRLEALGEACASHGGPLRTEATGWLPLPSPSHPRVLAVGWVGTPALAALHEQLARALADLGMPLDPRPFRPHVTVARTKAPLPEELPPLPVPLVFEPRSLVLYRSGEGPGPRYQALATWPVTGA